MEQLYQVLLDKNNVVVGYADSNILQPGMIAVPHNIYQDVVNRTNHVKYIGGALVDYTPPPVVNNTIPDNPTLGDWRVALALWPTKDAHGNDTTWLALVNAEVQALVSSGHPMGQVILQRLEFSNNVKRAELLQLMELFTFNQAMVDESLRRAYIVSLGDLNIYETLPSKYL